MPIDIYGAAQLRRQATNGDARRRHDRFHLRPLRASARRGEDDRGERGRRDEDRTDAEETLYGIAARVPRAEQAGTAAVDAVTAEHSRVRLAVRLVARHLPLFE